MFRRFIKISAIAIILLSGCGGIQKIKSRRSGIVVREIPGDSIVVTHRYTDTIYQDTVIIHRTKYLNLVEKYERGTVKIKCEQKPVKETEQYTEKLSRQEPNRDGFKDIWFLYIGMILAVLVVLNKILK